MLKKTLLSKAVKLALATGALSLGAVSTASANATTMYNLYNASQEARVSDGPTFPSQGSQDGGTDGWVWGGVSAASTCSNASCADPGWLGTTTGASDDFSQTAPFEYNKAMVLNWAVHLTSLGDVAEISQQDAITRYADVGYYPDIDTAGGAWRQDVGNGWRHNIDIGLFKSDVTQQVTLDVSGILHLDANFGITVYNGFSSSESFYNHHGAYFGDSQQPYEGMPYLTHTPRDPLTGLTTSSLTFTAQADQIYTIILGGNNGQHWDGKYDGYKLDITTVPVPGAVWLFGSALAGFIGVQRRKKAIG